MQSVVLCRSVIKDAQSGCFSRYRFGRFIGFVGELNNFY